MERLLQSIDSLISFLSSFLLALVIVQLLLPSYSLLYNCLSEFPSLNVFLILGQKRIASQATKSIPFRYGF